MNSIFNEGNIYAAVTAFYAISVPEFHMIPHSHQSCEIMYITHGNCSVFCEAEEFCLNQNQFVFLDAGIPHTLVVKKEQPCSILNLEFLCQEKETLMNLKTFRENSLEFHDFREKRVPYAVANDLRSLGYSLKDFITYLQKQAEEPDYLFSLLFQRMLLELSYCLNQNKKATGIYYLKKACAYIEENLRGTLRVPEIAAYTGVNKSYLQLLFSRFMNCTMIEYINQKRLEQAVFMLVHSSMSITDIAFSVGYNSRQHFAYTFEKYYQMSPKRYRKLHLQTLAPDTGKEQYLLEGGKKTGTVHLMDRIAGVAKHEAIRGPS